jgi:hypothetical protein
MVPASYFQNGKARAYAGPKVNFSSSLLASEPRRVFVSAATPGIGWPLATRVAPRKVGSVWSRLGLRLGAATCAFGFGLPRIGEAGRRPLTMMQCTVCRYHQSETGRGAQLLELFTTRRGPKAFPHLGSVEWRRLLGLVHIVVVILLLARGLQRREAPLVLCGQVPHVHDSSLQV